MDVAKDVVTVKDEVTALAPSPIRRAPRAEAVVRRERRPTGAVDITMNGLAAVPRGSTAPMVPLPGHWKARGDLVGIVCLGMALGGNASSVRYRPLEARSRFK